MIWVVVGRHLVLCIGLQLRGPLETFGLANVCQLFPVDGEAHGKYIVTAFRSAAICSQGGWCHGVGFGHVLRQFSVSGSNSSRNSFSLSTAALQDVMLGMLLLHFHFAFEPGGWLFREFLACWI